MTRGQALAVVLSGWREGVAPSSELMGGLRACGFRLPRDVGEHLRSYLENADNVQPGWSNALERGEGVLKLLPEARTVLTLELDKREAEAS